MKKSNQNVYALFSCPVFETKKAYTPNKKDQDFLFNYVRPADIHVRRDIFNGEVYKKPVKAGAAIALAIFTGFGAATSKAKLDMKIHTLATEYPTFQIAVIDRNILRLGLIEIEESLYDSKTIKSLIEN